MGHIGFWTQANFEKLYQGRVSRFLTRLSSEMTFHSWQIKNLPIEDQDYQIPTLGVNISDRRVSCAKVVHWLVFVGKMR